MIGKRAVARGSQKLSTVKMEECIVGEGGGKAGAVRD